MIRQLQHDILSHPVAKVPLQHTQKECIEFEKACTRSDARALSCNDRALKEVVAFPRQILSFMPVPGVRFQKLETTGQNRIYLSLFPTQYW